ncbi:hypothetical protein ACSFA0_22510 [Variovorax sp. LT1P1]|uniref:hypothetical protein n=1 Tax=Variovorax sp. LT1P1 TaxID=3443730 RepID=UPI003F44F689
MKTNERYAVDMAWADQMCDWEREFRAFRFRQAFDACFSGPNEVLDVLHARERHDSPFRTGIFEADLKRTTQFWAAQMAAQAVALRGYVGSQNVSFDVELAH